MPFMNPEFQEYCERNFLEGVSKMSDDDISKIINTLDEFKCPEDGCEKCIMHLPYFVKQSCCLSSILYNEKEERWRKNHAVL